MIVLLPVSRFRVPYETARGRPYSPLEALVLRAVADGGATLAGLRETFQVHERLLVESVVTLITAGWVAVASGSEAKFVLTSAGAVAVRGDAEPVSLVVSAARPQTVIMERVTGQVARHADARSWHRGDLGDDAWAQAAIMRERIIRNSLDEAQVQKLLQREAGHWVRRIGPIRLLSRATHYVAIDADVDTGTVRGLPHAWTEALLTRVLEYARTQAGRAPATSADAQRSARQSERRARFVGVVEARRPAPRTTAFRLDKDVILQGADAHNAALAWALENARTSVAVVSPTVEDLEDYRRVVDMASTAVSRGIAVDLLIGEAPGIPTSELVKIANAAGYRADPQGGRARLRTRSLTTGSGASLLVHDADPGKLTAMVGDHQWFGPSAPSMSVAFSEPSLAADAARAVASLWTGRQWVSPEWAGAAERWRRLASEAEESGALAEVHLTDETADASAYGELFVDDEHAGLVASSSAVLLGGYRPDTGSGEAAMRGVTLRVTGSGVSLFPPLDRILFNDIEISSGEREETRTSPRNQ